jgi:nitrate/nitrite transporter NarK
MQNSRQAYVNLALATAAFAVAFAAWSMISPLSHQIQADFNLDNTSIGLLIALPTLLGALMRVPMGVLTDRFGGRKVFTGLLLSRCCRSPSWASPTRFGPTWSGRSFWESPARASRPAFHS